MLFLFPVGRKSAVRKFPWVTAGLILLNVIVFLLTWPGEKRLYYSQASFEETRELAYQLSMVLTYYDSDAPAEIKDKLTKARESKDFPTPEIDEIFSQVQSGQIRISQKADYKWSLVYPRYKSFKESLSRGSARHSVFATYGFSKLSKIFPNIITYQFLHAGILHLFFNMLFLWIVGCNVEERWGPYIFLLLFLSGGIAAALLQFNFYPDTRQVMVGASGAVSAMMAAFLVRHPGVKIRVFYFITFFYTFRTGFFWVPAFIIVPLWLAQQLFWGLMTSRQVPEVGYWAHVGGFLFGLTSGIAIRLFNLGRIWEDSADKTAQSLAERIEKGLYSLSVGEIDKATEDLLFVVSADPRNLKARKGLLEIYQKKKDRLGVCREGLEILKIGADTNYGAMADDLLMRLKPNVDPDVIPDYMVFQLAAFYERNACFEDAVNFYKMIINRFPSSAFFAKAAFAAGKILYSRCDKKDEAQKYFDKLLKAPYDIEWAHLVTEYLQAKG